MSSVRQHRILTVNCYKIHLILPKLGVLPLDSVDEFGECFIRRVQVRIVGGKTRRIYFQTLGHTFALRYEPYENQNS